MNVKIETRHNKWKNLEPVVNTKGELYDDWGRIFEQMPERFMIGTDFHFGREGVQISKYKKKIKLVRRILGTINPEAVKLIAYENAEKLFKEIN
jgi:predicted TIM-barrel fold metal-dependent hydrolase